MTKEDIVDFIQRLKVVCSTYYLYHLSPPFELRKRRLEQRGPSLLIDLDKDQSERDSNAKWYGYVYENIHSPIEDADTLLGLIDGNAGLLKATLFCETD